MINKKFMLVTLGCAKNQVDSEALECDLIGAGLSKTDVIGEADLILLNSCGFINDARVETIDTLFDLHGQRRADSTLVLCGCLPARYDLSNSIPEVDMFLPSNQHDQLIKKLKSEGWAIRDIKNEIKRVKPAEPYAYLKISEGCDNYCSYCSIPYIKGAYTSKPMSQIVTEAEYLCGSGVRELVLTGQDTTLYGSDNGRNGNLVKLIDRLVRIDNCHWIRLLYAHPAHIDDATIKAIDHYKKVVKYLDIPIQHINSRILGLMNRKADRDRTESILNKLRSEIPDISIRTTLIVGFPGETDSEFGELLDFCESFRFDHLGVFKYSVEDGTVAERLPGKIDEQLIEERYLTLLDLQNRISSEKQLARVGNIERVLIHEVDSEAKGYGRARFQAPEVDGQVIIENCSAKIGDFVDVVISGSDAYDLYGVIRREGADGSK